MPTGETPPTTWTEILSIASSLATIAALLYAGYQTRQARISASAAASATIFSAIRSDIDRIAVQKDDTDYHSAVCDFLNNLELACALHFDKQYAGNSGQLTISLIKSLMGTVERIPKMLESVRKAIHEPTTFENIKNFAAKHKNDWKALKSE